MGFMSFRGTALSLSPLAVTLLLGLAPSDARAAGAYCSATADALYRACGNQVLDDYWTAIANCTNLTETNERNACTKDATAARSDGNLLCSGQLATRRDGCKLIGEGRYDPEIDPINFESDYRNLAHANRYFPLTIGNHW